MGGSLRWPPWIPEPYRGKHQPATAPEPNGGKPQAATLDRRALLGEASGGRPGLHSLVGESISRPPWIPEPYWGKPQAGTLDPGALIGEPQEATLTPRSSWGGASAVLMRGHPGSQSLMGGKPQEATLETRALREQASGAHPGSRALLGEALGGNPGSPRFTEVR